MQEVNHVSTYIAIFAAAEVAVVALFEIDTQFPGNFKLHVVQSASGFGHIDPAVGIAARLIHCFSPPLFRVDAIVTDSGGKYAGILFKSTRFAKGSYECEMTGLLYILLLFDFFYIFFLYIFDQSSEMVLFFPFRTSIISSEIKHKLRRCPD